MASQASIDKTAQELVDSFGEDDVIKFTAVCTHSDAKRLVSRFKTMGLYAWVKRVKKGGDVDRCVICVTKVAPGWTTRLKHKISKPSDYDSEDDGETLMQ